VKRVAAIVLCMLVAALPATAADSATPLLDLALKGKFSRIPDERDVARDLKQAEHALRQANAPADADCAASIGAVRFAALHMEVGSALTARGDYPLALRAFNRALACRPHDPWILLSVGTAQFDSRDYAGTRATLDNALRLDPRAVYLQRLAGKLAFVNEDWAEAVTRFRYAASGDADREQASYAQLMYWLAQMRAGMPNPAFVERKAPEGWPNPLFEYLRGVLTEQQVADATQSDDEEEETSNRDQEKLCEALFYVGQARYARGEKDIARRYFAAVINLKVVYFIEHGLARAEIAKLSGGVAATSESARRP
jgi:lipoprotein NlpI